MATHNHRSHTIVPELILRVTDDLGCAPYQVIQLIINELLETKSHTVAISLLPRAVVDGLRARIPVVVTSEAMRHGALCEKEWPAHVYVLQFELHVVRAWPLACRV